MSPSEKPVYRFVFLRHAESVGNVESRWQGQSNYPLTEKGRAQARSLCERWQKEDVKFDLVITSTLVRAQETAEIVTSYLPEVKFEFNPILMERHIGQMEGMTGDEVRQLPQPPFTTPYDSIPVDARHRRPRPACGSIRCAFPFRKHILCARGLLSAPASLADRYPERPRPPQIP